MTTITNEPTFVAFELTGADASKFLQGQLTVNTSYLTDTYQATAISNLKGRVDFGIWIKKIADEHFMIVISEDCADSFARHIKKYGAFSKIQLSAPVPIFGVVIAGTPTFSEQADPDESHWAQTSIANGNVWITAATQGLFQPQELRLHQRGGVNYDKGCYLGQEIIARLWFKASPKFWLHRVAGTDPIPTAGEKIGNVSVVNSVGTATGFEALVVARPEDLAATALTVLDLPDALMQPVGRNV